jgi:hypothetical protein
LVAGLVLFIAGGLCSAGVDGVVPGVAVVAPVVAPESPGVVGGVVWATAKPIVPTMAKALAVETRKLDLFMVKLR